MGTPEPPEYIRAPPARQILIEGRCVPNFRGWGINWNVKVCAERQRGTTLAEVTVAVGIAAISIGTMLGVAIPAVRHLTPDPAQVAVQLLVDREIRVASDLLKYSGSAVTPASVATSVPIPNASPLPVRLQMQTTAQGIATIVTISVQDATGAHTAQAQATIASRAPQPGSTIIPSVLVAAPTGAP